MFQEPTRMTPLLVRLRQGREDALSGFSLWRSLIFVRVYSLGMKFPFVLLPLLLARKRLAANFATGLAHGIGH